MAYYSGSTGFRGVKVKDLPRIARINTKKRKNEKTKKFVKIRVIRGKKHSFYRATPQSTREPLYFNKQHRETQQQVQLNDIYKVKA